MDMGDQEKYELENKNEDPMNYSAGLSSDWRFGGSNVKNTSLGLVQDTNSMAISKGDLIGSSSCSSASMVDSFGAATWNNYHTNSQNLEFCDNNAGSIANQLNPLGIAKGDLASLRNGIDRTFDMCWNQPNSMLKGGYYLPNVPVMLPQSLSQLPTDSAFIERAARFSCFGAGNFTDMVNNSFPISESVINPYSRGGGMMLGTQDVLAGNGLKSVSGIQSSKCELIVGVASKNVSMNVENGAIEGSPLKSSKRSESLGKSHDEVKGVGGSGNESDEAEFSGAGREEPSGIEGLGGKSSAKGLASKKRKRNTEEDNDIDGVSQPLGTSSKDNSEIQQKVDENPSTTINKTSGKNSKQGSQTSDPSKQEYIHVRARRGQATNSHSLAERVRREKISERMKFLQDLVPGCNKVTGKAVMLDEIINYVQSLQRQVEFLSMKLATVNPRLDFNLEGLLGKDILHPRAGPSHTLSFSPDMSMAYPMLHPSQGLIQAGVPGVGISPDILRRPIGSQLTPMPGGFKEPTQLPNVWDDELNNVIQMRYGSGTNNAPPNNQDVDGHMKAEL